MHRDGTSEADRAATLPASMNWTPGEESTFARSVRDRGAGVEPAGVSRRAALGGLGLLAALLVAGRAAALVTGERAVTTSALDPVELQLRAVAAGLLSRMRARTVDELVRAAGAWIIDPPCTCAEIEAIHRTRGELWTSGPCLACRMKDEDPNEAIAFTRAKDDWRLVFAEPNAKPRLIARLAVEGHLRRMHLDASRAEHVVGLVLGSRRAS